ncbi:glycosyltransferase family 2 protein [Empedobacter stercoris]|uniref:glycosyltransferase family 2 protein n=1 Tax=Empedobacter stercoris TaxID=1628248 RepID=UPI001CE03B48|nr:glycosyltransferase family 2 protein [Empedobacter stercoris]MCA4780914.1 glycosyltransferase family 2 protein [Empedobacter stercoris]
MYKVSIIIPNYNRANLIGETLDSIVRQTYENWECIIVDDGSTDNSIEVIKTFEEKDQRFKLYVRPKDYPKGANACRNIGMKKSVGDYIIFFDSDDLMVENHVEKKLQTIIEGNSDFVISKTEYFNNPENNNPINYRQLGILEITSDHFIMKKINWLTLDVMIKKEIAKMLSFTEKNQSAEEYNYFVKLVLITVNAVIIDTILSKRRFHKDSYQVNLNNNKKIVQNQFHYYYDTYKETIDLNISKLSREFLISNAVTCFFKNKKMLKQISKKELYYYIIKEFGLLKGLNKIRIIEFSI